MQGYREITAELLREIYRDASVNSALTIQEFGFIVERDKCAMPDIGMDVEPTAAVTEEGNEILGLDVISGSRERNHEGPAARWEDQLPPVGMIVGSPD